RPKRDTRPRFRAGPPALETDRSSALECSLLGTHFPIPQDGGENLKRPGNRGSANQNATADTRAPDPRGRRPPPCPAPHEIRRAAARNLVWQKCCLPRIDNK